MDHDSLKYLVNKQDLSGMLVRWIFLLHEFFYKVKVRPGTSNVNADYLSRQCKSPNPNTLQANFPDEFPDMEMPDVVFNPGMY